MFQGGELGALRCTEGMVNYSLINPMAICSKEVTVSQSQLCQSLRSFLLSEVFAVVFESLLLLLLLFLLLSLLSVVVCFVVVVKVKVQTLMLKCRMSFNISTTVSNPT